MIKNIINYVGQNFIEIILVVVTVTMLFSSTSCHFQLSIGNNKPKVEISK